MLCKKHKISHIEESDDALTIISTDNIHWMLHDIFSEILFFMRVSYLRCRLQADGNIVALHIPNTLDHFHERILKDSLILAYVLSSIIAKRSIYIPSYADLIFGIVTGLTPDIVPINAKFVNHIDKISPSLQGKRREAGRLCRALKGTIYDPETIDFSRYVRIVSNIRGTTSEVINALKFASKFFISKELEFIQAIQSAGFSTIIGVSLEVLKDLLIGDEE